MKQNRITEVEYLHVSPPDAKPMLCPVFLGVENQSIKNNLQKNVFIIWWLIHNAVYLYHAKRDNYESI